MKISLPAKILALIFLVILAVIWQFSADLVSPSAKKISQAQELLVAKANSDSGQLLESPAQLAQDGDHNHPVDSQKKLPEEESIEALSELQESVAEEIDQQQAESQSPAADSRKKSNSKQSAQSDDQDFITFNNRDLAELQLSEQGENNLTNQNRNSGSGMIPGVRRQVAEPAAVEEVAQEEPSETAEAFQDLPKVRGQARGYNMLSLMHPRARETVERQLEALEVSGIQDLYLSVLTDGTFAQDFDYLKQVIQRLNNVGDSLTLVLYATNGPTMRDFSSPITDAFNQIDPRRFRELIQFNQSVREEFKGMVSQIKPIYQFNRSLNPQNRNIAIVMLEDNLTNAAYQSMRELAKEVLGTELVEYYRNPCEDCFPGNEADPMGDKLEVHSTNDLLKIGLGDAFTNDGQSYRFSEEAGTAVTLGNIEQGMLAAQRRGSSYFGLWREERQGLNTGQPRVHPDQRIYEVPTTDQLIAEISVLRNGLIEIVE